MEISRIAQGGAVSVQPETISRAASIQDPQKNVPQAKEVADPIQDQVLSKKEAQSVVEGLNGLLSGTNSHLKFEYHDKLKEYYVTLVDDTTKEIVREIPPKKLLDMVAAMWEQIGIIVDKKI